MSTPTEQDQNFALLLSREEVIALIKFHTSSAKRVPKRFGDAVLKLQAGSALPQGRALKVLKEAAEEAITKHSTRARMLLAAIEK